MGKTIVMLFDGTSNGFDERRTNILRLYGCLRKTPGQLVWYDPGVGSIGGKGWLAERWQGASELLAQATGRGIDENVKEAYRFLVEHYDRGGKATGRDRICLFGFSRGAYSARMLAGFLHAVGLIEARNLNLLDHLWRAYKRIGQNAGEDAFAEVRLYERILRTDRPAIHLLGLFDTVSSVIEWRSGWWPRLSHHAHTQTNPSVAHVRHALALDERRLMFRPVPWPEGQAHRPAFHQRDRSVPQDTVEMWFTGAHSDVGGGLTEDDSALAKIPLLWMIEETAALGLVYDPRTVNSLVRGQGGRKRYTPPDPLAAIHNPLTGFWALVDPLLHLFGGRRQAGLRVLPANARLHESVLERARHTGMPVQNPRT